MNRKLCIGHVSLAVVLVMISSAAEATLAIRVFVAAKTGNDANACSSVATPCQTLAGAMTQVNAGGEIIVLESGGYGPVTINKAVNINAPAGIVAFIHPPSGDAITINAGPSDTVILRGLTLNGGTNDGISVGTVGQVFVEHCVITGYAGSGISVSSGALFMRDDDVRRCSTGLVVNAARAVVRDCSFADNASHGVLAAESAVVTVTNSVAAQNAGDGFRAATTTSANVDMTLDGVHAVSNATGITAETIGGMATGIAVIRVSNSVVTQNQTGVRWFGNTSAVYGTSPGTSLVAGNGTDGNPLPISNITLR